MASRAHLADSISALGKKELGLQLGAIEWGHRMVLGEAAACEVFSPSVSWLGKLYPTPSTTTTNCRIESDSLLAGAHSVNRQELPSLRPRA